MNRFRVTILAAILTAAATAAAAQSQDRKFFQELDSDGNKVIDREEFDINKSRIFYSLDKDHNLTLEPRETKLPPETFRRYAGADNALDGVELFDLPAANFGAFDRNDDQKISPEEFRDQLAELRAP